MNEKQLHALAAEFAKNLKTPEDLNQFSRMLKKITVEAALNGELTDHLGYEKHQPRKGKNARNGYTSKTVICDEGEIEIETPRDRDGTFEPQLIKKNQTRITGMDEQIIALYAKGLSNQEIVEMFKELYDA
ncbi:transposase, partial [Glaesserella parasuis]|nr:transposase [Glaesserella parasuis]